MLNVIEFYVRGADGYPIGADHTVREGYGRIPEAEAFVGPEGQALKPVEIQGWCWSISCGHWRALVRLESGWEGVASPVPTKREQLIQKVNSIFRANRGKPAAGVEAANALLRREGVPDSAERCRVMGDSLFGALAKTHGVPKNALFSKAAFEAAMWPERSGSGVVDLEKARG